MLFTLLFLAFLGGVGVVSVFGYKNGQPERLLAPLDADGKFCGLDDYATYPYIYIMNLNLTVKDVLSSTVCVQNCPMANDIPVNCKSTQNVDCECYKNDTCNYFRYNTTEGKRNMWFDSTVFGKACLPIFSDLPAPL